MAVAATTENDYAGELNRQRAMSQLADSNLSAADDYHPSVQTDSGKMNQAKNQARVISFPSAATLQIRDNSGKSLSKGGNTASIVGGRYMNQGGHLIGAIAGGSAQEISEAAGMFGQASRFATAQMIRACWQAMIGVYSFAFCVIALDIFWMMHFLFPRLFAGVGEAFVLTPLKSGQGLIAKTLRSQAELGGNMLLLLINVILGIAALGIAGLIIIIYEAISNPGGTVVDLIIQ